jgi:adenosylhomocysteine nucleosidase
MFLNVHTFTLLLLTKHFLKNSVGATLVKKLLVLFLVCLFFCFAEATAQKTKFAIIISANTEWKTVKKRYSQEKYILSPWGEYFFTVINNGNSKEKVLFFHEGWGKTAAAGGTQYVIDSFDPEIMINLGTCGGFEGKTEIFDIILADRTVIYDIKEAMGDSKEAISDYTTEIDISWLDTLNFPAKVTRSLLVSADRDLVTKEINDLENLYGAIAGDWESGSIAYVASRNKKKLLILRGVTDIVSTQSGEAYNNFSLFEYRTDLVMNKLLDQLPLWIGFASKNK